jgi:hypothetical protein
LGFEVGVELEEPAIRSACKKEGIVDAIAVQKPLISNQDMEKRVERAQGQLETHGNWEDWKKVLFSNEVHFCISRPHTKSKELSAMLGRFP